MEFNKTIMNVFTPYIIKKRSLTDLFIYFSRGRGRLSIYQNLRNEQPVEKRREEQ